MKHVKWLKVCFMFGMCFIGCIQVAFSQIWYPGHAIQTVDQNTNFSIGQTPSALVEQYPAAVPNTGLTYQWYSSSHPLAGFAAIPGATGTSYTPPTITATSITTYYYRVTTSPTTMPLNGVQSTTVTSNTVKIKVVSIHWEDVNYIREHDVLNYGQTSFNAIDQLPIGSKLQTTTYLDGLGRSVEKISKQTATPASGSTWGDVVQFSVYDVLGRQPKKYLPYSTTNQSGNFKTTQLTDQAAYYSNAATYNETSPFSNTTYDNSPLNRVMNVKEPGTAWAASVGNAANYDMNTTTDNVEVFTTDYAQGDAPVAKGYYAANTLYKNTYSDVNNNQVVEFTDKSGQLILKKVQAATVGADPYAGWICTYYVYDDFGLLRFQIQPMGTQYLVSNSWALTGTNGTAVLAEQVFQYNYDDKGRTVWKKAPGASGLNMVYDIRDRVVYTQDGNQAALATPQWMASIYDALDRPVISALYNTTESVASLQSDAQGAPATSAISVSLAANNGGATVSETASLCPANLATSLNSATASTVLKYLFYDNYAFPGAAAFSSLYTNLTAYSTSDQNVFPIATDMRTLSMPTGEMVRVLGSNTFLPSTNYFDEKGRHIQTVETNIRSGTDITTMQYRFDGRLLSTCNNHTNASAGFSGFYTLTKYVFDIIGRVSSIQKQLGTNPMKTVANYNYDDMGRLAVKHLDPAYNNPASGLPDLESLNYSYNIHNQITGINKDYATKNSGTYSKWGHFFGLYLGYDNRDNVFTAAQLNGQVTGQLWSTQGDDVQRRYDYTYDPANRLTTALYVETQTANTGWNHTTMDFKVTGHSGSITYDINGNLQTMAQSGVLPGISAPTNIDDLTYAYNSYSNKLKTVTDAMTAPTYNGLLGDFKDGANGTNPDYVYDANGNQVVDLNKNNQSLNGGAAGTNGVHYNYLDKPDQIRIVGQGTIAIVYDADGQKLQRLFIPETAGASTVTTYIGAYVYTETSTSITLSTLPPFSGTAPSLAYINFEEGRVRAMTPVTTTGLDAEAENGNLVLPAPTGGKISGAWDYFIMDYQQNVRMVLTEETHQAMNTCTMELTSGRPAAEDPVFGQSGSGNEVEATRTTTPTAWTGNTTASVCHVGNLSGHTLGPNSLQKVMAGDRITASTLYYYAAAGPSSNPNILPTLLNNLLALIGGNATSGEMIHSAGSGITSQLNTNPSFMNAVEPSNATTGTPQAYLTILFFDERFTLIPAANGGVQQLQVRSSDAGNVNASALLLQNIQAPKNGYAYIYISNRSDQDVFFDNFTVSVTAGNIIEEDHYYPFGLKIAAISSHKLGDAAEGKLSNPYLYNGKEQLDENAGLNWYDYGFRNYDPQIGRFPQLDPLTDGYPELTPFQFAGNDPIANVDVDGLEPLPIISTVGQSADGTNTLLGVAGDASRSLINAGQSTEHWLSTLSDAFVVAKLPAKGAAIAIKPLITTTISLSASALLIVDKIAFSRAQPVQELTNDQRKQLTLVIHDKVDPDHILIQGHYSSWSTSDLHKDAATGGYMWTWKPQAIYEDNGFWIDAISLAVPVAKAFSAESVVGEGVYDLTKETGDIVKRRTTVLGKYPDYTNLAEELGAKRFNVPTKIWNKTSAADQWAANKKFLDRMIMRGDKVILSNPVLDIKNVSGAFRQELDYLIGKGYRLNSTGTQLIK